MSHGPPIAESPSHFRRWGAFLAGFRTYCATTAGCLMMGCVSLALLLQGAAEFRLSFLNNGADVGWFMADLASLLRDTPNSTIAWWLCIPLGYLIVIAFTVRVLRYGIEGIEYVIPLTFFVLFTHDNPERPRCPFHSFPTNTP